MDRPTLPTRSPELTRSEHLAPLGHPETGVIVGVDKGWLDATLRLLDTALGAVARGNTRAQGNVQHDRCVRAIYETGKRPADCPAN